jgi:transcription initiation factor TFIID subunit TAF12
MAKVGVTLKIDVTKIDKSKLFKGQKGTYLDAQVFIDIDQLDQFGNSGMITQAVSKEDREAGQQGAILGNAKVFWKDQQQAQPQQQNWGQYQQQQKQDQQQQQQYNEPPQDYDDSIPF